MQKSMVLTEELTVVNLIKPCIIAKKEKSIMNKYNFMKLNHLEEHPKIKNLLIQKSGPLRALSETDMTLAEFKILDVYLGRIDSRNPESREVVFTKGELERLLEVTKIDKDELKKRVDNLGRMVEISDPSDPNKLSMVSLFEKANAWKYEDGLWKIILKCSPSAMKYIFNIENIGYIRYRLHNVLHLKSRYSYFMFLYLEHNRFRKSWTVSVLELRKILNCMEKTYDKYYRFNELVLTPVKKELHKKTTIKFEYTGIKQGRAVKSIKFKITKLPKELEELKDCEKNQNELTISENKDYTDSVIENEIEEIDEIVEQPASKIEATKKDESSSKRSLTDILKQCEEAVQENTLLDEVKEKFKYEDLVENNPKYTDYFDFIFRVLCETIGTESDTIRIKGVNKKAQQVILHLAKLKPEEILYVTEKYAETDDVKNPEAYVLTMLYGAVGRPVQPRII